MEINISRKTEQTSSVWTGGTTTQLAIHPHYADYKLRNFRWRMSSACVETEESTFTKLSEVHRHIMILDGNIRLVHSGRHEKTLGRFDKDEFEGDWDTRSFGKCVDFNLMTIGANGSLNVLDVVSANLPLFLDAAKDNAAYAWEAFYCVVPNLSLKITEINRPNETEIKLEKSDYLLLYSEKPASEEVYLKVNGSASGVQAVWGKVWL